MKSSDGRQTVTVRQIRLKIDNSDSKTTGIETVGADSNAPAEYFDLLGRRVATPQPGQLVIRRQGNTATKVVFE